MGYFQSLRKYPMLTYSCRDTNDKTTTLYGYDGEHRLVWLQKSTLNSIAAQAINTPATAIITTVRYTYDALGRRLQKVVSVNNESTTPSTTHFGWDGDRLVCTQTDSAKVHTVYEPGSFVPLLRISQAVKADSPKTEAEATEANARGLLALASKHGKPEKAVNPDDKPKEPIKLPGFGTAQWAALSKSFTHLAEKGYPEHIKTVLRQGGLDPDNITAMAKAAVAQQQAEQTAKLTVQMYHCNHLGTPIALINTQGMIDWAVELDPWGNVLNEFNPNNIDQPIRMQGQQIDHESGLFYNRHRYYDPQMGRYITQDPIGLAGGVNLYGYVDNPNLWIDPMGLAGKGIGGWTPWKGWGNNKPMNPITGPKESGVNKTTSTADSANEISNVLTDKTNQTKRIDEALICKQQENKKTKEISTPYDVIAPDSNGIGVIRQPSPSEIGEGYKCTATSIRPGMSGTLPGFEAPGR
jgi:RHS repeat-associated protein